MVRYVNKVTWMWCWVPWPENHTEDERNVIIARTRFIFWENDLNIAVDSDNLCKISINLLHLRIPPQSLYRRELIMSAPAEAPQSTSIQWTSSAISWQTPCPSNMIAFFSLCHVAERITIKKWSGVCHWSYDATSDTCGICRNPNVSRCINCISSNSTGECEPAKGSCGHMFHNHCLTKWLQKNNTCPIDSKTWEWVRLG